MRKNSKISFVLAAALICAGGGNIYADEANADLGDSIAESTPKLNHTYDLGRIERVVTTSPDSNTTISVVTSEDIANNGAQNVAEALRHTQGVFI